MDNHKTVLIADDDKGLVEILSIRFKHMGYKVNTAYDGIDAIAYILTNPPDLVILDVNMPGADGLNVCEKIMEYQSFDPIPVVLLTGRSDPKPIETATRTGAYYLRKNDKTWETLKPLISDLMAFETSDTVFKNTA